MVPDGSPVTGAHSGQWKANQWMALARSNFNRHSRVPCAIFCMRIRRGLPSVRPWDAACGCEPVSHRVLPLCTPFLSCVCMHVFSVHVCCMHVYVWYMFVCINKLHVLTYLCMYVCMCVCMPIVRHSCKDTAQTAHTCMHSKLYTHASWSPWGFEYVWRRSLAFDAVALPILSIVRKLMVESVPVSHGLESDRRYVSASTYAWVSVCVCVCVCVCDVILYGALCLERNRTMNAWLCVRIECKVTVFEWVRAYAYIFLSETKHSHAHGRGVHTCPGHRNDPWWACCALRITEPAHPYLPVCMYVCMYVWMYVYVYVCVYACMYV
jgi:hypothetical protein